MSKLMFWIKERHNPQIGIYWVACGRLTKKEAKARESSLYGNNYMHSFPTEKEYLDRLDELRKLGAQIQ